MWGLCLSPDICMPAKRWDLGSGYDLELSVCKSEVHLLSPRKLHPLWKQKDPKNHSPKNYSLWTFAAHMTQIQPKKYNFTQFAALFHFLFTKINCYFV